MAGTCSLEQAERQLGGGVVLRACHRRRIRTMHVDMCVGMRTDVRQARATHQRRAPAETVLTSTAILVMAY